MKINNALIIGAGFVDISLSIKKLPKTGDDALAKIIKTVAGGCALNIANILRSMQVKHDLLLPVGAGSNASLIKAQMINDGYKIFIEDKSNDNACSMCFIEENGERTFISTLGVEVPFKKEWFKLFDFEKYDLISLSGYDIEGENGEIFLEKLESLKHHPTILFDASPRIANIDKVLLDRLFKLKPIIHANKDEIGILCNLKVDLLQEAMQELYKKNNNVIIVTASKYGCAFIDENGIYHMIPGFKTTQVDTTGAGDSHVGGIISGLYYGYDWNKTLTIANRIASNVVQIVGARYVFDRDDLLKSL